MADKKSHDNSAAELRGKSVEELNTEMLSLYREQFNLRMQRGAGQDVKPHNFKRVRRQIARIQTIINQMQSASA